METVFWCIERLNRIWELVLWPATLAKKIELWIGYAVTEPITIMIVVAIKYFTRVKEKFSTAATSSAMLLLVDQKELEEYYLPPLGKTFISKWYDALRLWTTQNVKSGHLTAITFITCSTPVDMWISGVTFKEIIAPKIVVFLVKVPGAEWFRTRRLKAIDKYLGKATSWVDHTKIFLASSVAYCVLVVSLYTAPLLMEYSFHPSEELYAKIVYATKVRIVSTLLLGGFVGKILDLADLLFTWAKRESVTPWNVHKKIFAALVRQNDRNKQK